MHYVKEPHIHTYKYTHAISPLTFKPNLLSCLIFLYAPGSLSPVVPEIRQSGYAVDAGAQPRHT